VASTRRGCSRHSASPSKMPTSCELRAALLRAAGTADAQRTVSDQFGDRYMIEFEGEIEGPRAKGIVRSTWDCSGEPRMLHRH
jgi:hypothetical protein